MLTLKKIYSMQTQYKVTDGEAVQADVKYQDYLENCRNFITNNLPHSYSDGTMTAEERNTMDYDLVVQFIDKHKVLVEGYITPEGILDVDLLLQDVTDSVTGAGILTEGLEDVDVDEIQINDKNTIFVQKKGVLQPYVDKHGRLLQFVSDEEIRIVMSRLIDDGTGNSPQITDGAPILNAKTAKKQYRVSMVHHTINTRGPAPYDHKITNVVIRKFKETKLTMGDVIRSEAITPKMGRLLKFLGTANLKMFFVGPTGSGKTTLLNIVAEGFDLSRRIMLVQNPTEISFFERYPDGRLKRNVVHWESNDRVNASTLVDTTLRQTPEIIVMGESRENTEFLQALRAMQTGHIVLGTFHAESAEDAIHRYANEYSSIGGSSYFEALKISAKAIDIIITQFKFPDGKRRVLSISEIMGVDADGEVVTNDIFKFEKIGKVSITEDGLKSVKGEFVQNATMSERLKDALYSYGTSYEEIEEFCDKDLMGAYNKEDIEELREVYKYEPENPQIVGDKEWVTSKR